MDLEDALRKVTNMEARRVIKTHLFTDLTTELPNERAIDRRLEEFMSLSDRTNRPFTYVKLDIAGMKYVNDNYGDISGTRLINYAASFLSGLKRRHDFLGREFGDDFVMLLEGMDDTEHEIMAERIEQSKELPLFDTKVPLIVYYGLATYIGQEAEELKLEASNKLNQCRTEFKNLYPWLIRK